MTSARTRIARGGRCRAILSAIALLALSGCDAPDQANQDDAQASQAASNAATSAPQSTATGTQTAGNYSVRSQSGRHVVEFERVGSDRYSDRHEWRIRVLDEFGQGIPPGTIAFGGAMPAHRHGFANRPLITGQTRDGWYTVEGVRFHMPGAWILRVDFLAPEGMDHAELTLDVPY